MAFVVDEYGDIQGYVNSRDYSKRFFGEFTSRPSRDILHKMLQARADGTSSPCSATILRSDHPFAGTFRPTRPQKPDGFIVNSWRAIRTPGTTLKKLADYMLEAQTVDKLPSDGEGIRPPEPTPP